MYLYLFNPNNRENIIFLVVPVLSENEYDLIVSSTDEIVELLLNDNCISKDNLLIFSLIKEFTTSIENLILPLTNNNEFIDKDEKCINELLIHIFSNYNCMIYFELNNYILKKMECDYNLSFLIDKYN
jgi:hypothetical protein